MCFIIPKCHFKVEYAIKNKPAFKIVRLSGISWYQNYRWSIGLHQELVDIFNIKTVVLIDKYNPYVSIYHGFHSYIPECSLAYYKGTTTDTCQVLSRTAQINPDFGRGYGKRFLDSIEYKQMKNAAILIGYIPIGARYMENAYGEMVSEKFYADHFIKPLDRAINFDYEILPKLEKARNEYVYSKTFSEICGQGE